jgi:hypothetical protein
MRGFLAVDLTIPLMTLYTAWRLDPDKVDTEDACVVSAFFVAYILEFTSFASCLLPFRFRCAVLADITRSPTVMGRRWRSRRC